MWGMSRPLLNLVPLHSDYDAALVSPRLPDVDLGDEPVTAFDAAIETLAFEHADLDLNHVEPAGVLGRVVELKPPEHAAGLGRWEGGVESGGGVGGEVVEDDADALGLWGIDIDEFAHAKGEVVSGALISDLDPAPGAMGIEEDEEIDDAVAAILAVEGSSRPGAAGIGWRASPMSWVGLSSKQTTDRFGSGGSA